MTLAAAAAGDHLIRLSCAKFERLNCSNTGVRVSLLSMDAMFCFSLLFFRLFFFVGKFESPMQNRFFIRHYLLLAIGDDGL